MPTHPTVPASLMTGPFSRAQALKAGLTSRQLQSKYIRRLFPQVFVLVSHAMTDLDWIAAAALAMPQRAQLSHLSRIQALGLDVGALRPIHFTVSGDLHLAVPDVFLHRTEVLPPLDDAGVMPAAAFIQFCATARMIDAIKVGDWLLHERHMTLLEVGELALRDHWRPGARQARRVLPALHAASRSVKESETRAVLAFAGLPRPDVNKDVCDARGQFLGCGDLVYILWKLLVEYEGRQHEGDLGQWNSDIDRYRRFRDDGWRYVQVTNEKIRMPRKMVAEVYGQLVRGGYCGPPPVFGAHWLSLFAPISIRPAHQAVA